MRRIDRPRTAARLVLALLVATAGCGDASGPLVEPEVPEAEVEALLEVLAVMDSTLESEAWHSLQELGGGLLPAPASDRRLTGAAEPSVQPHQLGRTYEFQSGQGQYVLSPSRLGAPGNGVRLILYQPQRNRQREIGWVDVLEDGASLANRYQVRVRGVARGQLFADYRTTVLGPAAQGLFRPVEIHLEGQALAGQHVLSFDLESVNTDPFDPTLDLTWTFRLEGWGFSIQATARDIPITGQGVENPDFFILYRGIRWRVRYNDRGGRLEATVLANGREFATATGTVSSPTIVGPTNVSIAGNSRTMILRLLLVAAGVFETYNDLFTPPGAVIFQGL